MAKVKSISPDMTVRQLVTAWPVCEPVMERLALSRIGDRWSLQELGALAQAEHVNCEDLLGELASIAGVEITEKVRPPREPSPAKVLLTALGISLTLGAGWGVILLLKIADGMNYDAASPASVHIHGLAQLWGWMALFIFAVGTHLLRKNTPKPASAVYERVAAAAILAGIVLFFSQLIGSLERYNFLIGVAASSMMVVAALCFAASAGLSLGRRGQRPQRWHWFVIAGSVWLVVWAVVDLVIRVGMGRAVVPSDAQRHLLIVLPVLGFAVNMVYGFGIRLIPGFLNIGNLRQGGFLAAVWVHNAGLVLLLVNLRWWSFGGAVLMMGAVVIYLGGMNWLRSKPSREIFGIDPQSPILIRIAFGWLAIGMGMICVQEWMGTVPHPFSGAWRHALTVGFITSMILGVGQRLVPIMLKQPLASLKMMRVAVWLIVIGNFGRVTLELVTIGRYEWAYRLIGITGILELTAITLFALNVYQTLRNRQRVFALHDRLRADTRVREAVNVYPQLQQDIEELGVTMLSDSPFIAPSLTFGAMALAWGMSPEQLIKGIKQLRPGI